MRRQGLSLVALGGALVLGLSIPWPALAAPKPAAVPGTSDVIVMLKDQHRTGRVANNRAERSRVVRGEQAPLVARAKSLGASNVHQLTSVNAVAMRLSTADQVKLAADPDVASILPDLQLRLPDRKPAAGGTANAVPSGSTAKRCPADPTQPLHEPEALQTMRVEGIDGSGGAHAVTKGAGVTVGFIADGLDPENPDFQRNGKSIFTDYQDFTTDGPTAPTSGAEAFGDASGIAAQGNVVYDLADFVNEAHPLPTGCNVTVTGVAPGADLVGLKVFGVDSAPTSRFIQAVDYAVNVAHVDVLNESFGSNPYPDTQDDPISLANDAAIKAGVTVVASTGDAGVNGTVGSPASSPGVIAAAATTNFRGYTQTNFGFVDLPGVKSYANENISALSSGGFAQNGKVPDVSAPGDEGWAVCGPDQTLYVDCADYTAAGGSTGIQLFGGTSQSSPLTAGTAALVIAAYRTAHPGAPDPSPALVKRLITSTARDLGHPVELQGSGEVDAHAAVRAALSVPTEGKSVVPASAAGTSLISDHTQLDLSGAPGQTVTGSLEVTNASTATRTLTGSVRALTDKVRSGHGSINFTGSTLPALTNAFGAARAYAATTIPVAKGVDRLDASIAFQAPANSVFGVLVDPHGVYSAYSLPQGNPGEYNFAHLDVRYPAAGNWKLYVLATPTYSGKILYNFTQRSYAKAGSVAISDTKLTSGDKSKVTVKIKLPSTAGDLGARIQLRLSNGTKTTVPVSLRGVVATSSTKATSFKGVITGGNGRASAPAQTSTYDISVPAGRPNLSVGIKLTGQRDPRELILGYLVSPQGQALGAATNLALTDADDVSSYPGLQLFARKPVAGRWRLVLEVLNPVGGNHTFQPFTGSVSLAGVPVTSSPALPNSAKIQLAAGEPVLVDVKVKNTGVTPKVYFADARLSTRGTYTLASQTPGDDQQNGNVLASGISANWLVPTRTQAVSITAASNQPIGLDAGWNYGSPEIYAQSMGATNTATASIYRPKLVQGPWYAQAAPLGPFTDRTPTPGTVSYTASATTKLFDPAVQSSTGDYWQTALIPAPPEPAALARQKVAGHHVATISRARLQAAQHKTAPAAEDVPVDGPLVLAPGKSGTITLQITPQEADRGKTVKGAVDIDTFDPALGTGDEVGSLAYTYTVR